MGEIVGTDGDLTEYQFDLCLIETYFEQKFSQSIVPNGLIRIGRIIEVLSNLFGVLCNGIGTLLDDCLFLLLRDGLVVLDDFP